MADWETETDSSIETRDGGARKDLSSSDTSSDSCGGSYDALLSQFLQEVKDIAAADKVDLERQENLVKRMKTSLEKKKAKVLAKVHASRIDVGQRVLSAPEAKNPRQELARETYIAGLDSLLTSKEKEAQKKDAEIDFRIELVEKRIQKRRRQSEKLINDLQKQEAIQEAAAREREENEERNMELDRERLKDLMEQGVSPPVAMPAEDRIREKERRIRQAQYLKDISDLKERYRLYMNTVEKEREGEMASRRAKRADRDEAILRDGQVQVGGGASAAPQEAAATRGQKEKVGKRKKRKAKEAAGKEDEHLQRLTAHLKPTTLAGDLPFYDISAIVSALDEKRAKLRPDAVATAAYNIAAFIMDYRVQSGDIVPDADEDVALESLASKRRADEERKQFAANGFITSYEDLLHERNLEQAILPDRLRSVSVCSGETEVIIEDDRVRADNAAANANVAKALAKVAVEQNYKILNSLTLMTRIQHLHSLALLHSINVGKTTRDLIAGQAGMGEDVERLLKEATKATLLASDADLQALPFNDVSSMMEFCKSRPRIEKLLTFLLTYVAYDQHFIMKLLYTVFTPQLQHSLYWSGKVNSKGKQAIPDDAEIVPRVIELLFIRVAYAAHNMHHINDDSEFDEKAFANGMREALYNTKRNVRKRQLVLSQRMVNYLGTPAEKSASKRTKTATKSVSYVFDNNGKLTDPVNTADDTDDNSEQTLYQAILNVIYTPQSVDELDDLLQDFIAAYEDEPVDNHARNVIESVRTAMAAAGRDENKAGVLESFKAELEEIKCRKLRI